MNDPIVQQHRRKLLRVLLWFTTLFGFVFITINFFAGKYLLIAVEVGVTGFALVLLAVVNRTTNLHRWTLIYLLVLYSGTTYALVSPVTSVSVFGWVLIMPMLAHLLLGRLWGGLLCAFFVPFAGAIFVWRFGTASILDSPGSIANVITVVTCSFVLSHVYEASRAEAEARLSRMALTDSLTGLPNRSSLEQTYARHISENRLPLALLMIDLDHFKRINDVHGHGAGDTVLRAVGNTMNESLRETDLASRLGGEEFCVLLPDTGPDEAHRLAERMREAIEALECRSQHLVLELTASIGIAVTREPTLTLDALLHRADQNLYRAKHDGRNRVAA